jgi:hypothetical protein
MPQFNVGVPSHNYPEDTEENHEEPIFCLSAGRNLNQETSENKVGVIRVFYTRKVFWVHLKSKIDKRDTKYLGFI